MFLNLNFLYRNLVPRNRNLADLNAKKSENIVVFIPPQRGHNLNAMNRTTK